ncbi:MAG: phosphate starvation-inducible protein PhoH, partial [Lachnospira sp.]
IGMVKLTSQDVVRHPLVQKIVKAYEEYESRMAKKQTRSKQARTRNGEKNDNKH